MLCQLKYWQNVMWANVKGKHGMEEERIKEFEEADLRHGDSQ